MVGEFCPPFIEGFAQIQNEMTHRICRMFAVEEYFIEGGIAVNSLILFKGNQQIEERFRRNTKALNRGLKGNHDGVSGLAGVTAEQFLTPPGEEIQSLLSTAGFIGKVIGPAAISIDGVKMRHNSTRQECRGHREILVVSARPASAITSSGRQIGSWVGGSWTIARQVRSD